MERYEEVEAPAEPAPVPTRPKPRPKKAPKKPRTAVNVGQTCYTRGGEASVGRPARARWRRRSASATPSVPGVDIRVPRLTILR